MFDPPKELLEPHFFEYDGDLYGRKIEVELIAFLRDELVLESEEALSAQIARDAELARQQLAARPGGAAATG
jgi:riboflavin kinase/FMN adenylyltransferase